MDFEEVNLGLELRQAGFDLLEAILKRLIAPAESFLRQLSGHVQVEQLVHLGLNLFGLRLQGFQEFSFLAGLGVGLTEVAVGLVRRDKEGANRR